MFLVPIAMAIAENEKLIDEIATSGASPEEADAYFSAKFARIEAWRRADQEKRDMKALRLRALEPRSADSEFDAWLDARVREAP
jgi:hypothetical protein